MVNFLQHFFFLRSLAPHDRKKVKFLFKLYQKLDNDIAAFQKSSGLKCREGCGQCCENPKVTTSILELLPVAFHLWQNNKAQTWLDEGKTKNSSGACVFYKTDSRKTGMGRCSIYRFRPLICRLFGFSAMSDKHGKKQLLTCPIIKESYAEQIRTIENNLDQNNLIPKTTDYTMQVQTLDSSLSQELPINEAIHRALEKVGLIFQYKR